MNNPRDLTDEERVLRSIYGELPAPPSGEQKTRTRVGQEYQIPDEMLVDPCFSKAPPENARQYLRRSLDEMQIRVLPDTVLRKRVFDSQRREYERNRVFIIQPEDANEGTKTRWIINYIRHRLTDYDRTLAAVDKMVGGRPWLPEYKKGVLRKIAQAYPKYAEECMRQVNLTDLDTINQDFDEISEAIAAAGGADPFWADYFGAEEFWDRIADLPHT